MSDFDRVNALFDQYVAAFRAGHGNVNPFLDQVEGEEREELAVLIEAHIETGPVPEITPERLEDPALAELAARVTAEIGGAAGGLSRLLVTLRQRLKLQRTDVVDQLAAELEARDAEKEKVHDYYHDLEWGTLPAAGLSDRVLDCLARILKTKAGELRAAGRELGPGRATSGPGLVFSRTVPPEAMFSPGFLASIDADGFGEESVDESVGQLSPGLLRREKDPPDRIDRLFTSG